MSEQRDRHQMDRYELFSLAIVIWLLRGAFKGDLYCIFILLLSVGLFVLMMFTPVGTTIKDKIFEGKRQQEQQEQIQREEWLQQQEHEREAYRRLEVRTKHIFGTVSSGICTESMRDFVRTLDQGVNDGSIKNLQIDDKIRFDAGDRTRDNLIRLHSVAIREIREIERQLMVMRRRGLTYDPTTE